MSRLMILPMSKATLFSLPGSHPAVSVKLMLDYKGIDFKTIDLMPLMHKAVVRAAGFPGTTVPALKFNGEKLQGSVDIARALDRIVPEPPLLPADEDARKQVLMAEARAGGKTVRKFDDCPLGTAENQQVGFRIRQHRATHLV